MRSGTVAIHLLARSRRTSVRTGRRKRKIRYLGRRSPVATYIICTNPRSGSWLLSDGLASTSVAGNPREWFNPLVERKRRAQWRMNHPSDLTDSAYLDQVRLLGTTANGLCGIKLHYYQFAELSEKLQGRERSGKLPVAELIARSFGPVRYIWLTRRDKARQAISYHLACARGEWWIIDGAEPNKGEGGDHDISFDPQSIARLAHTLKENDVKWQDYFRDNNIRPLTIFYEDLASDYAGTVAGVLKWLGIASADTIAIRPSRFKAQSNALNEDWLVRYRAYLADVGTLEQVCSTVEVHSPLAERSDRPVDIVPDFWKRWIARNKLLKVQDDAIMEVLVSNGYSRQAAVAAIAVVQQ